MDEILPVPHVPQFGPGANRFVYDCGAAAGCSLLRAYGLAPELTVDNFFVESGATTGLHYVIHTKPVLERYGLAVDWKANASERSQRSWLDARKPYLSVVWNGRMWHSIIVCGSVGANAWIHDPLDATGPRELLWSSLMQMQGKYRAALVPRQPLP